MFQNLAVFQSSGESMTHLLFGPLEVTDLCAETGQTCSSKEQEGIQNVQHMCQFNSYNQVTDE